MAGPLISSALLLVGVSLMFSGLLHRAAATVELRVNFLYYSNPNGWDANGASCDPAGGACDPVFTITVSTPDGGMFKVATDRASDQNTVQFGNRIVNINNPVVYQRPRYGGFTLHVKVEDFDPIGSWDYMGTFTHTFLGPAGANFDFRNVQQVVLRDDGRSGASLALQIAVGCLANFYSADCTKLCVPANDDSAGHFICDSAGSIVCLPTFDPASGSCRQTYCATRTPCKNGGTCSNLDSGFACSCVGLWGGATCEEKLSACESSATPCRNNGSCVSATGGSGCVCSAGFNGTFCEADIDECALPAPVCQHATACRNQFGTYSCQCADGWTGKDCSQDVNECAADGACFNGATCDNSPPGNFTCHCQPGFRGSRCELDIDECAEAVSPCRSDVEVCRNLQGSFICLCAVGWTGENCTARYVTEAEIAAEEKNRLLIGLLVPALLLVLAAVGAYFGYRLIVRHRHQLKGRDTRRMELPPRMHSSAISTENASYAYAVGGFGLSSDGESPYEDAEAHYTKVQSLPTNTVDDVYSNVVGHEPPPDFVAPPLPPKRIVAAAAPTPVVTSNDIDVGDYGGGYEGIISAPERSDL